MISPYAAAREIEFARLEGFRIRIGEYIFDRDDFHALLRYVERGGFPRWQNDRRPEYVIRMREKLSRSANEIFSGLRFEP